MENKKVKFPIAGITGIILLVGAIVKLFLHIPGISSSVTLGFLFVTFIEIALYIYLGIVLLAKKRNILLLSAVSGKTILKLVYLIQGFSVFNILDFVSFVLLTVITIFLSEQSFINVNSEKTSNLCKKFYFLPSALLVLSNLIFSIRVNWLAGQPFIVILDLYLSSIIEIVASFIIAYWLVKLTIKKTEEKVCQEKDVKRNKMDQHKIVNNSEIPNIESLSNTILNAIRPNLKAPLTAVLCSADELVIVDTGNNTYSVEGNVNSQNSYGAMISTDFTVNVQYKNETWVVTKTTIGVKNAKKYATNFVLSYILLSIFVAIMAAIGYFIISAIVGM